MVYSREIDGRVLSFGSSGLLMKNTLIMYDNETDSLWPTMLNRAIKGKLSGTKLVEIPGGQKTTWGEWRKEHPESKVLSVNGREHLPENVYAERFAEGKAGVRPIENPDERLGPLERVLGVIVGGEARAYPVKQLFEVGAVEEEVARIPVLIVAAQEPEIVAAFDRRLGEEVVSFSARPKEGKIRDVGGTLWDLRSGRAIDGPAKGKELTRLYMKDVFWFIWADYNPGTSLYGEEKEG